MRSIVVLALAALAAAVLVQRRAADLPARLEADLAASSATALSSAELARRVYSDEIRLERADDGHYYAEILVNRTPVRVLVDTGATVLVLRDSDAAAAGIHVMPADFKYEAKTANGTARIASATADEVELGALGTRDVVVGVARDDDLWISLLGMNVLSRLGRVAFDDNELVLAAPQ